MLNKELTIKEKIIFDEPMKNHTSFKIGGVADQFVIVNSIEELTEALKYAKEQNLKKYILGNGSNILVTDKGIRGLVIKVNIQNLEIQKLKNHIKITVGAGYKMMQLSSNLMKEEITGFEELSGIPGTIGGAIYMNAGAYNKEISDIILYTKCMDEEGNIFELSNDKQEFGYRTSIFQKTNYIIIETKLKLEYGEKQKIQCKMQKYMEQRKVKQPIEYPTAGSSFKRTQDYITAKLIDECGLKGYKIGGAKISEKHAGFIVNYNNATAKDVIDLIKYVKEKVYEKYGIKIEEEIKIIGEE